MDVQQHSLASTASAEASAVISDIARQSVGKHYRINFPGLSNDALEKQLDAIIEVMSPPDA